MTATEMAAVETRSRSKGSSGLPPSLAEELKAMLGQRFSTTAAVRDQHDGAPAGRPQSDHHRRSRVLFRRVRFQAGRHRGRRRNHHAHLSGGLE